MDWLSALFAALAGGSFGAFVIKFYQTIRESRSKDRADVWQRQGEIIDKLEQQNMILEAELQRSRRAEITYRQQLTGVHTLCQWLYNLLKQQHEELERLGGHPPPLPAFPDCGSALEAQKEDDFAARSNAHTAQLLRKEAERLKQLPANEPSKDVPS